MITAVNSFQYKKQNVNFTAGRAFHEKPQFWRGVKFVSDKAGWAGVGGAIVSGLAFLKDHLDSTMNIGLACAVLAVAGYFINDLAKNTLRWIYHEN